jgi:hypothetical protein
MDSILQLVPGLFLVPRSPGGIGIPTNKNFVTIGTAYTGTDRFQASNFPEINRRQWR